MALDLILRLLHIVPAIFLAGGVFFMWCALVPAFGSVAEEHRQQIMAAVRGKWAKVVMASSGLLLISGLINAVRNIPAYEYTAAPYHVFVMLKLVLAVAIMFITARLSGRSAGAAKFQEKLPFWMTVNSIALLVLIAIASTMRVSPRELKAEAAPSAAVRIEQMNGE